MCLVGLSARSQFQSQFQPQQEIFPIDGYAAVVNDRVILVSEVMAQMDRGVEQADMAEEFDRARNHLIDKALILEEFKEKEGDLPDRALNEHEDSIIRDRYNDDQGAWLDHLSNQQLTAEEWRDQLRDQLVASIMRHQEVSEYVSVAPAAIHARYERDIDTYRINEQYKLHRISVSIGETDAEQKAQAEKIKGALTRLQAGEDFGVVAEEVSEDPWAASGGDWGWKTTADLREELVKAIRALPVGEVARVIQAGGSLYVILVEAHQPGGVVPFEDVQQDVAKQLRTEEAEAIQRAWLNRLRNKHFVEVYDLY